MAFIPAFLQAANQGAANPDQMGMMGGFGMLPVLLIIMLIMYFFMLRPQNKKQKELQKMLDALKKGDKVVTIGGIHGTVSSTSEKTVIVKVDDNTKIEFNRTAIATVVTDKPAEAKSDKKSKKDSEVEKTEESGEKDE